MSVRQALKAKNRQLKSLVAEVNMLEVGSRSGEHEEHRLHQKLVELKKKYFQEKKRRQEMEEARVLHRLPVLVPGKDLFTGGGFRVTQY